MNKWNDKVNPKPSQLLAGCPVGTGMKQYVIDTVNKRILIEVRSASDALECDAGYY